MEPRKQVLRVHYNKQAETWQKLGSERQWALGVGHTSNLMVQRSFNSCNQKLIKHCQGKLVLDYGCGQGAFSALAARNGASVIGVDLSERSVINAKERASHLGISEKTNFLVMDGENLGIRDNIFDIIFSSGLLSCVDIRRAFAEWIRTLKPTGCVIGVDALGHNPFLNFNRRRKTKIGLRPQWITDHVLRMEDLDLVKEYFGEVHIEYFHLITLLAAPFYRAPGSGFYSLLTWLESIDTVLLRFRFLQKYSHKVVFTFAQPKKSFNHAG
jgi:ubiquinone/menaquinone biosynthesis C-methylase UbiE